MDLIGELYAIEKACCEPEGEGLAVACATTSRAVMEDIVVWVYKAAPRCSPERRVHEAIGYMLNMWPGLALFLFSARRRI